jgi:hypothetical protein
MSTATGILEIPALPAPTIAQLVGLLNDRIRDLNTLVAALQSNPATAILDMGTNRIINVADPKNDLDAVNLRTLKHPKTAAIGQQQQTGGLDSYAIVFSNNGNLSNGAQAPGYPVQTARIGNIIAVGVMAIQAPTSNYSGNVQVQLPGGIITSVLSTNIILPAGQLGPVYSMAIAYAPRMPQGTRVTVLNTLGGNAGGLTLIAVVKRTK